MTLTRGRVVRQVEGAQPVAAPSKALPRGRRVDKQIVEAEARAREIIALAEARAAEHMAQAERQAADLRVRLEAEARATASAQVAAHAVRLAEAEAKADERSLTRSVELARVLAERLLGQALRIDPSLITELARQALSEARGARTVRIVAHPDDVTLIAQRRGELGLPESAVTVLADPSRKRGHLRLETDIGVLDGELGPQLHRLADKLKESLEQ